MREIKFRGIHKNPYGDKWVHGYYAMKDGNHVIIMPHANDYEKSLNERKPIPTISVEHTIDVNTLGQYTGLKDKNGVEIYEGDIVQARYFEDSTSEKYVVKYDTDRAGFFPFACGDGCGCCETDVISATYAEILGNIYDNPELIEKGR